MNEYILKRYGCFPTTDMQTPPPLRSGHLDIKDAQYANKMMGGKLHITSKGDQNHIRSKGAFWTAKTF